MAARKRSTEPITAAADGSALGNPGPAGWAWYVDETTWHAGGWPHGTNNMGELQAVLDLLRATAGEPERELHILCDSQYVINCITRWMPGWKKKGWTKKDGKPVLNRDILEQLDAALAGRRYDFEWVKGHAGHPLNEAADERARAAATAFRDGRAADEGPGFGAGAGAAADAEPQPTLDADPEPAETAPRAPAGEPNAAPTDEPAAAPGGSADVEPLPDGQPRLDGQRLPDVDRLPGLEARLAEAEVYTDAGRLARLVAPELTWVTWRGRLADRATALRYPERAFALDGASEVVRVERVGERAGVVVSRIETRRGQALRTSLWRAEEDGWVLAHRQDTPTA